ncbi:MAG: hypothetical protein ACREQH_15160, partial [Candidatus Binatus sp.]
MIEKPGHPYFVNVPQESEELRLLRVDIDTMFVMSDSQRIVRENDPDRSSGPRVFFAGCLTGNVVCVRHDVDDRIAQRVLDIAAEETPWRDHDLLPACVRKIAELLSGAQRTEALIFKLQNGLSYEHPAPIVRGDSAKGRQLLARLVERG